MVDEFLEDILKGKPDFQQPKCTCGSVECGLIFIPELEEYQCGSCIFAIYAKAKKLATGCQLTLDFHNGRQWTDEQVKHWKEHTGTDEPTQGVLYRTIRRLMDGN